MQKMCREEFHRWRYSKSNVTIAYAVLSYRYPKLQGQQYVLRNLLLNCPKALDASGRFTPTRRGVALVIICPLGGSSSEFGFLWFFCVKHL